MLDIFYSKNEDGKTVQNIVFEYCQTNLEEVIQKTIKDFLPLRPISLVLARRLLGESFAESYEDFIGHYLAAQHRAINSEDFMRLVRECFAKN